MLNQRERVVMTDTGMIPPDRLRALAHALNALSRDAQAAARSQDDQDGQAAAALRGKKLAYFEAALMVEHVMNGGALHPRRYSSAAAKARAWGLRRREQRESSNG